ncbi:hypothetical protein BDA99DRAFT_558546 [Phascolomyces articulosus]|uniref:Uncharacterized protein n=1 Tax=Phascolomyces articulosus TaxID=60185 RepID=A0AAD5PF46_9FUNG|nr:hypothetical protein BDA99DRAFT_558546 [Phascolomyces articulosus]
MNYYGGILFPLKEGNKSQELAEAASPNGWKDLELIEIKVARNVKQEIGDTK